MNRLVKGILTLAVLAYPLFMSAEEPKKADKPKVAVVLVTRAPNTPLLILIVSLWAIATGILEVLVAVFVPRFSTLSWAIALAGVVSCALGIVMLDWNNLAEIGLLYFFAAYAVVTGVLFVTVAAVLRSAFHRERGERARDTTSE